MTKDSYVELTLVVDTTCWKCRGKGLLPIRICVPGKRIEPMEKTVHIICPCVVEASN